MNVKLAIIGGGNIGKAIANGLVKSNTLSPSSITITRAAGECMEDLEAAGYNTSHDNSEAIKGVDIVMLCVKPYQYKKVLTALSYDLDKKHQALVSVVAMASIDDLENIVTDDTLIARVIPNTAIDLCQSMNSISTNKVDDPRFETIKSLFEVLGKVIVLEDSMMNAAMAITSCGTAYFLRMMRAAEQASVHIGIKPSVAQKMVAQTALGAAALVLKENSEHTEAEIDKVTTAGGLTIKGLNEMERLGMSAAIIDGIIESFNVMEKK